MNPDPLHHRVRAVRAARSGAYAEAAQHWDAASRTAASAFEAEEFRSHADTCRREAAERPHPDIPVLTIQVCGKCETQLGWFVGTHPVSRHEAARFLAMEGTRLRASHGVCRDRACLPAWMAALEEEDLRGVCEAGDERAVEGSG